MSHSSCPSSLFSTLHLHLSLTLDFSTQIARGYVENTLLLASDASVLFFDSFHLSLLRVLFRVRCMCDRVDTEKIGWKKIGWKKMNTELNTELNTENMNTELNTENSGWEEWIEGCFHVRSISPALGDVVEVELGRVVEAGNIVEVRMEYETRKEGAGLQWLTEEQANGKPFVYSQGQAILARTYVPCQDNPEVKFPYSASIRVPKHLVALCSGMPTGTEDDGEWKIYSYVQIKPIASYLIAVVAGDLKCGRIGPRSSVWAQPHLLDAAIKEFDDVERFIQAGEKLLGVKYDWGIFDVCVLPGKAFPYGGMENCCVTFLSSALITGDKSLTNVLCHEIVHSWAGNLVTNSNWSDFWLNEGFDVYIERMILGEISGSEVHRHFEILIGYNELLKTIEDLQSTPEFAKLQPEMTGIDPDDAFSKIPYEKGSLFLFFIEYLLGSRDLMTEWLKCYFSDFNGKSLNTEQMRAHFEAHFVHVLGADSAASFFAKINWQDWLKNPGLPSFDPNSVCNRSLVLNCEVVASNWFHNKAVSANDLVSFSPKQVMFFLDLLMAESLSEEQLFKMNKFYSFSSVGNVEISVRWLLLNLKNNNTSCLPDVVTFLGKHGRGLYVKPLFLELFRLNPGLAEEVFERNSETCHSVIRSFCRGVLSK